jgi:hypothetical protein
MKSLINCENPSSKPLQKACSGISIAACDNKNCSEKPTVVLKIVPKAGRECALEKINH